jgi:hypothetical protein
MRMILGVVVLVILAATSIAQAQTVHTVTLTWTDTKNPNPGTASGTTYDIYRATAACSSSPTFPTTPLASSVAALTYLDNTVSVGSTYCYEVTAVYSGVQSLPSNTAGGTVLPFAPSLTTVVIQ